MKTLLPLKKWAMVMASLLLVSRLDFARAQAAPTLIVRVLSPDGKPVWGAIVMAKADTALQWKGTRTNARGEFSRPASRGRIGVRVGAPGFRPRTDTVEVTGSDTTLDVILVPDRYRLHSALHLGGPARASLALGPAYLVNPGLGVKASDEVRGTIFAVAEPGVNAARVSVGYQRLAGNLMSGWSARGSVLKRWKTENALYIGAEASLHIVGGIGPRIGVFMPVHGTDRRSVVVFWNIGIGG